MPIDKKSSAQVGQSVTYMNGPQDNRSTNSSRPFTFCGDVQIIDYLSANHMQFDKSASKLNKHIGREWQVEPQPQAFGPSGRYRGH